MTDYDPHYREWSPGRWEEWLPESKDDFDSGNRSRRVDRLSLHIKAGADRSLCRQFVYTEEEWRSGVRMAGKEPGDGWITWPKPKPQPDPQPEPPADVKEIGTETFADVYDQLPF